MWRSVWLGALVSFSLLGSAAGVQSARIPRDGFDLCYRVYGAGRPVLLLTGGPGFTAEHMTAVAERIGAAAQVILPELRGTGKSRPQAVNAETVNVKKYLEDFEALRSHLGFARWTVLGHSAGGLLAMLYAAAHPGRVDALILVGSAAISSGGMEAFMDNILMRLGPEERQALAGQPAKPVPELNPDQAAETLKLMLPGYFFDRKFVPQFLGTLGPNPFHFDVNQLLTRELFGPGYDLRPALKSFARPVLVVNGRQDPIDPGIAYEIHLGLKNSTLKFINRCGHFPWIEQPEKFHQIVREFLVN